jgi:hypothetical protein
MADRTTRIELPEGNWWELVSNPKWREIRTFQQKIIAAQAQGQGDGIEVIDMYLIDFTEAWSFEGDITEETIGERDTVEMVPVMKVVNSVVLPLLLALGKDDAPSE